MAGLPVFTTVQGQVMVEHGKLVGDKGYGQPIIDRKIAPEIPKRPVC
ncbi:hypothetical protein ACFLYG_00635 [Chloroflexota bacterium]